MNRQIRTDIYLKYSVANVTCKSCSTNFQLPWAMTAGRGGMAVLKDTFVSRTDSAMPPDSGPMVYDFWSIDLSFLRTFSPFLRLQSATNQSDSKLVKQKHATCFLSDTWLSNWVQYLRRHGSKQEMKESRKHYDRHFRHGTDREHSPALQPVSQRWRWASEYVSPASWSFLQTMYTVHSLASWSYYLRIRP